MNDLISRQAALYAINTWDKFGVDERGRLVRWHEGLELYVHLRDVLTAIVNLPSTQPETHEKRTETHACDCISRQAAISELMKWVEKEENKTWSTFNGLFHWTGIKAMLECLPSAQPKQRYTEEELRVFQHGISLSLLSKRSAQHWRYDEDTATEIKFLERLYDKVVADMGGEQDE